MRKTLSLLAATAGKLASLSVSAQDMSLLSGDAVHFRENYESNGAPWFNHDRSQTVASLDRIRKLLANTKGTLIIQHDARDIQKLPAFPAAR